MLVNWDDDIPSILENKSHVPVTTNQSFSALFDGLFLREDRRRLEAYVLFWLTRDQAVPTTWGGGHDHDVHGENDHVEIYQLGKLGPTKSNQFGNEIWIDMVQAGEAHSKKLGFMMIYGRGSLNGIYRWILP